MTSRLHSDFCWNQDECNICTPNHHEIRLVREVETLAKQTNKANAWHQSAQIWSSAKEELICSLCEKTPMRWTPPCWKCSYKWIERIYRTWSIVLCPHAERGNGWTTHLLSGKSPAQDTQQSVHRKQSIGTTERMNLSPERLNNSHSTHRTENTSPKNKSTPN